MVCTPPVGSLKSLMSSAIMQTDFEEAESLGGKTMAPPMPMPIQGGEGHIAVFIDPAGNTIGLRKL